MLCAVCCVCSVLCAQAVCCVQRPRGVPPGGRRAEYSPARNQLKLINRSQPPPTNVVLVVFSFPYVTDCGDPLQKYKSAIYSKFKVIFPTQPKLIEVLAFGGENIERYYELQNLKKYVRSSFGPKGDILSEIASYELAVQLINRYYNYLLS